MTISVERGTLSWYPYAVMSRFVRIACESFRCPSFSYISHPGPRAYRARRAEFHRACQALPTDSSQQVKTVRVGWLVNNEGFQDGTPGERLSGWGYEYLQTLSYYTPGWRYEYVSGTFTELMDMLEAGEIDLMPNISYSEERAQNCSSHRTPRAPSATTSTPSPIATIWPRGPPSAPRPYHRLQPRRYANLRWPAVARQRRHYLHL